MQLALTTGTKDGWPFPLSPSTHHSVCGQLSAAGGRIASHIPNCANCRLARRTVNAHPCEVVQSRWSTLPETAKLPQTAGDQVSRETDRQSPYGALSLTAPEIVEGVPLKLLRSDLPLAQLHAISGQRRTSADWMPEADPEATVKPHRSCRQRTDQNTALRRKVGAGGPDAPPGPALSPGAARHDLCCQPTCPPLGCPSCKSQQLTVNIWNRITTIGSEMQLAMDQAPAAWHTSITRAHDQPLLQSCDPASRGGVRSPTNLSLTRLPSPQVSAVR